MLSLLYSDPLSFLIFVVALLVAITIHEFSHAWMADKLGDPTARINKRLTLNPLAHLDPIGALALFLTGFGWGKPVPIDPYNLHSPKRDAALISLAGPASNLILASLLSLTFKIFSFSQFSFLVLISIITLNVVLAVFNLLPIPPLDGSKILMGLLPHDLAFKFEENLGQYGLILLIFVLFPLFGQTSLASLVISPIINSLLAILLP